MVIWLNTQGFRSSDGFEVHFTDRFTAQYREGDRHLVVDVKGGGNGKIDSTQGRSRGGQTLQ